MKLNAVEVADAICDQVNIGAIVCCEDEPVSSDDEESSETENGDEDSDSNSLSMGVNRKPRKIKVIEADNQKTVVGVFTFLNLEQHKRILDPLISTVEKEQYAADS